MEKYPDSLDELVSDENPFLSIDLKSKLDMSDALHPHSLILFSREILESGFI